MKNIDKYVYYELDSSSYVIGIIVSDYNSYFRYRALETNATNWVIGYIYYGTFKRAIIADSLEQLNKIRVFS